MRRRQACAAGTFYPADPVRLREEIERSLGRTVEAHPVGAPSLPYPFGLVVPHAGYRYSGAVAATGYTVVHGQGRPEAVVLLGANHTGLGGPLTVAPEDYWDTPLAPLPVHTELAEQLAGVWEAERDDLPFAEEHSVEVQLPFLRYLFGEVPIVPVVVQSLGVEAALRAGNALARVVKGRGVLLVASSDFTHYEPQASAEAKDRAALGHILNLDVERFLEMVLRERLTICGAGAIAVLMAAARALGLFGTQRLAYRTSGDVVGLREQVVGYATVALRRVDDVA